MEDSPDPNVLIVNTASGFRDTVILGVEHRLAEDGAQKIGGDRGYEAAGPPIELFFLSQVADDEAEAGDQDKSGAVGQICRVLMVRDCVKSPKPLRFRGLFTLPTTEIVACTRSYEVKISNPKS